MGISWKRNFDSHLRIKGITLLSVYPCFIGKACICNVFHPRAKGLCAYMYVTTFTIFVQKWSVGSLLALCGSTVQCTCIDTGQFFSA